MNYAERRAEAAFWTFAIVVVAAVSFLAGYVVAA